MARNAHHQTLPRRAQRIRRWPLVAVLVAIIVSIVAAGSWLLRPRTDESTGLPAGSTLPIPQDNPSSPDTLSGPNPHLYSDVADAKADIAASLNRAAAEHKRVLLSFGGNWCGDCQILDIYLHQPPNRHLLDGNFLLVHVNIGHYDRNLDIARQYGVPLQRGVPALVVLAPDGGELFVQRTGEFERMAEVDPVAVTAFLDRWKA